MESEPGRCEAERWKKASEKTAENIKKIRLYLQENGEAKTSDIADFIGLSAERIRVLLAEMSDVERIGRNRDRIYRLKKDS
ncbi:MAG TPA: hypothetical protein DIW07_16485 [Lachnospiraceae bacterium]|nr:hypothetical protein [Lachnospiraceae bacterium]HCM22536.1 hypothetical protein [Porphyromonadaceae bacterium]HCR84965.1 hypothetical protein [Lachnospiraceae bacterium]